jgi:hypothetical protein
VSVQTNGFAELLADISRAADEAIVTSEARKVVVKGVINIQKDWRKRWSGLAHAPAIPRAITTDVTTTGTTIVGEVGPDKDKRQGALGNLLEYGSVKNAPIPGGAPALEAEEPRYIKALEDLAGRLIEGGDGR